MCVFIHVQVYRRAYFMHGVFSLFKISIFLRVFIKNILCTASRFQHCVDDHISLENTFLQRMYLFKKCLSPKNTFLQNINFPDLSTHFFDLYAFF